MSLQSLVLLKREISVVLFCISLIFIPSVVVAQVANVYDCVHYAENENDLIVNMDCITNGLASGADPNWIKRQGKSAKSTLENYVLLVGLSRDQKVRTDGVKAVQSLIDGGARLQPIDASILFWAISGGNTELVQSLLLLGASPTVWPKSEIGTTLSPAETAAAKGYQQIVELLVKHGAARPNSKDALQAQFVRTAMFGTQQELSRFLSLGVDVNEKTRDEETALVNSLSMIGGLSDCEALAKIRWLLANGVDVNLPGKILYGVVPPLHAAVWITGFSWQHKKPTECALNILRGLITKGARVAGRDSFGQTPLHVAALSNNVFATQLLLESGSTVMPRDNRGKTPLDITESGEIIKLLKKHGATER